MHWFVYLFLCKLKALVSLNQHQKKDKASLTRRGCGFWMVRVAAPCLNPVWSVVCLSASVASPLPKEESISALYLLLRGGLIIASPLGHHTRARLCIWSSGSLITAGLACGVERLLSNSRPGGQKRKRVWTLMLYKIGKSKSKDTTTTDVGCFKVVRYSKPCRPSTLV